MTTELDTIEKENQKTEVKIQNDSSGAVYGLGMIGAWIYFIGRATTNQERVVGFFKGIAWPAILVKGLFEFLNEE